MTTHLKHKEQFQEILRHYRVSDHGISVLHKVNFVGMLGITSSGRNTIMDKLVEDDDFTYIVSDTTRPPRKNNGILEKVAKSTGFGKRKKCFKTSKKAYS